MKLNLLKLIFFPLILSLYSSRVNYESEKVESPRSTFSSFSQVKDSTYQKKYVKALKLFANGEYSQSLESAIDVVENSKDVELNILTTKLIGEVFESINNHKKAIDYFKKTLQLIKKDEQLLEIESKDLQKLEAECLLKIGGNYLLINEIKNAKQYLEDVIKINNFNREIRLRKADAHSNLSIIYFSIEEYKDLSKAKFHANEAIRIHKELNQNQSLAADYGNLASIYLEEGKLNEAKELYNKALDFLRDDNRLKAVKYKVTLYDNLGWTLRNLKDYVAYDYLDRSVVIRDSLREKSWRKTVEELELKHNKDIAVREVESQKKIAQQNTWLVGGIGVSAALLLLYFLNVYKLRQQKLQNELSKNELIQQKKIEKLKTESQTKILNATIDGKETERKQIAETLHDNISAMLSSANLHLQATQKQFNGSVPIELEKTQKIITQASQQIRDLSHNLVSSILLKFGLHYALKDAAEKYSNSEITFHTQLDNLKRYDQDFEIKVYNIVQEFINNVLKHSKADRALIRLREKDNQLFLSIEDNGIGFNAEESIANGGIGLNQIMARVKMMKGTFKIDSEKNQGTTIKIVLPVKEKEKIAIA